MLKKKLKIGLIGFGRFGKRYFDNINKSDDFKLEYILRKKRNTFINDFNIFTSLDKIKNIKTDGVIIATSPKTHFKISKFFFKKKSAVILEKPAVSNLNQLNKIIKIKKDKAPLLINHSDLYNPLFIEMKRHKNKIGKIKSIIINFGKFDYQYTVKRGVLPLHDWLPHILATLVEFLTDNLKFKVRHKSLIIKNKCFFQELHLDIFDNKNKILGKIFFSNLNKERTISVEGTKGFLKYDGYNLDNNYIKINSKIKRFSTSNSKTPMENLLDLFAKSIIKNKNINDLKIVIKYQKYLDKIIKII